MNLDNKIVDIRSDHGTEFKNTRVEEFYAENGMSQFLSFQNSSENGFVEKKNMTLVDITRTMLINDGLPINFLAEAVNILSGHFLTKPPMNYFSKESPNLFTLGLLGANIFFVE